MGETASKGKGNKNNPNNKGINTKQNKPRESGYCEKECKDVGSCEKYKLYIYRIEILHKTGYGISCDK